MAKVTRLNGSVVEAKIVRTVKSWSRWPGTGYRSEEVIFASESGEKFYGIIDYNMHSQWDGFYDRFYEIEDPRPARRKFWRETKQLSQEMGIPHDVVRALKGDKSLIEAVKKAAINYNKADSFPKGIEWELSATGIRRRKNALAFVLGEDLYAQAHIEHMGQGYSSDIAAWVEELITPPKPEVSSVDDEMWL